MTDIPEQPQAHGLRIESQPGSATISIDGTSLPTGVVTGYVLQHDIAGGIPLAVLHTRHADQAVFDGFARVAVGVPKSPGEIITEFLAQVDPVLLDQTALNRSDYGGEQGATARAMLQTLAEWATGQKAGS